MPGLARKLLVFAAVNGLILQPIAHRGQRPAPAVKIAFEDKSIGPAVKNANLEQNPGKTFEAFGVVGLVTVSKFSFLITITRRQQVAQIQGKPVYVVTEVALTPLTSKDEAESSISRTQAGLQKGVVDSQGQVHGLSDSDSNIEDEGEVSAAVSEEVEDDELEPSPVEPKSSSRPRHDRASSIAEDVIQRRGGYGRFAQKWFSKSGWTAVQRRNLGMSVSESGPQGAITSTMTSAGEENQDTKEAKGSDMDFVPNDVTASLLPKLLQTTQILFGSSHSFYFSYDFDITRRLDNQKSANSEPPLHMEVDPLFFWNRNIISPFIEAGQVSLALPLMQGFVGQRAFTMDTDPPTVDLDTTGQSSMEMTSFTKTFEQLDMSDSQDSTVVSNAIHASNSIQPITRQRPTEKSFLLTLISRRSAKRAGLRYLRRGVDEEGNTANEVETEQVLSPADWTSPSSVMYSFVQLRGSIPIFWSQSPYSFKPIPQLLHSTDTNLQATRKHFDKISARYGSVQVASLVEKHGTEAIAGGEYEKYVSRLNESREDSDSIGFEWFDFHSVCRGMHFENVSLLLDSLEKKLDEFGSSVAKAGEIVSKQKGVLRTNCMDCLDRSNVVQSACARRALEMQLKKEDIDISLQVDQSYDWFNNLWADNGDAISTQYASTAALKGDFTRTGKRNYKGALTDMGLSISRFYSGIVNDYFSQAAIDFLLGNVTYLVFEEFEANTMSVDPAVSMYKMRQQAIGVCQKRVVADDTEEFIDGWTLLTPRVSNTIKSTPFEEIVLLITDAALYACRFDWNTEKVSSFERVDLRHIHAIKYGTYITSTLSAAQSNEKKNIGFAITYEAGRNDMTRVNTRSLSTVQSHQDPTPPSSKQPSSSSPEKRVLAFKALPSRSAALAAGDTPPLSEIEQVETICREIERMALLARAENNGEGSNVEGKEKTIVGKGDVITLAEARKNTGLIEQLGHSLKKLVWA